MESIIYPDGSHAFFEYDEMGRVTSVYGDGGAHEFLYDYDSPGGVRLTDPIGAASSLLFDDLGQLRKIVDADGNTVRYAFDGNRNLTAVTLPGATTATFDYDAFGNLTRITDPLGHQQSMAYGKYRRLTSLTDAQGVNSRYHYDEHQDLTQIAYSDGTTARVAFDAQGNVTESVNARGDLISYTYDEHDQLVRKDYGDGSHVDFTRDARRNLLAVTDASGTVRFSYDDADRVTSVTYPDGRGLAYEYGVGGRRSRMTDQDGTTINYAYDAIGRLSELTDGSGSRIVAYGYDSAGRLARADMGNGTYTTYEYTSHGAILHLVNHARDDSVISRFDYSYDELRRPIGMRTLDGDWDYAYDGLGQLALVESPDGSLIRYTYDDAGNRVSVVNDGVTESYTSNSMNQYTSVGNATFAYDRDGNLVFKIDGSDTWTYTYDVDNRLVAMTSPNGTWTYEYNALGHRVATVHDGLRTEYLIDPFGIGDVVAEYDGSDSLVAAYAHGLGLVSREDPATGAAYYSFDASANTTGLTDETGTLVNRYEYLPFGEQISAITAVANPFTFVGQLGVMDDGGQYYMRNRSYAPDVGRFTQPDPVGLAGGSTNLYRYAENAPTDSLDPSGLYTEQVGISFNLGLGLGISGACGICGANGTNYPDLYFTLGGETHGGATYSGGLQYIWTNADSVEQLAGGGAYVGGGAGFLVVGGGVNGVLGGGNENPYAGVEVHGGISIGTPVEVHAGGSYTVVVDPATGLMDGLQVVFEYLEENGILPDLQVPGDPSAITNISATIAPGISGLLDNWQGSQIVGSVTGQLGSHDPNDILGPSGYGAEAFIVPDLVMPYTIRCENDPEATAAAQEVSITQQLDADLDWSTFQLGSFGFGEHTFYVPGELQIYSQRLDMIDELGLYVDVDFALDADTGLVTWQFTSIDPVTGEQTLDPLAGFLPPNETAPEGEGFVNYAVEPLPGLPTGTEIAAQASIVFDTNDPIDTNELLNTVDTGTPTSQINPLPAQVATPTFDVSWSGSDDPGGSGIAHFDVHVSQDGGLYSLWLGSTSDSAAQFAGEPGHTYAFFSVATDNVGHKEFPPDVVDAMVYVASPPVADPNGPYDVLEGGTILLDGSGSSDIDQPDNTPLIYEWDFDYDGATFDVDATGVSPLFSAASLDGPATATVALRVTDDQGLNQIASTTVSVGNVDPTVVVTGAPATGSVGVSVNLAAALDDPGAADTHEVIWTCTLDGSNYATGNGAGFSFVPGRGGTYLVTATATDDDGGAGSDAKTITVDENLGEVDFLELIGLNLAGESLHFSFSTAHSGFLTAEVVAPKPPKSARLRLFDTDPVQNPAATPLVSSDLSGENQRLDWAAGQGETYYVEFYGENADFDFRIANLLHHDAPNGVVTVHGTDGNDTFEFDAAASRDVTVNGVAYHFDDAQVESVAFDGSDGYDTVILDDSIGDDTLTAEAKHAVFSNSDQTPGFTVTVDGFEELQAYARSGGTDKAYLYDSDANDKFKSEPAENYAKMYGGRMYNRVKFYDVVEAFSSGEKDLARLFDTAGNDVFEGQRDVSWLRTDVFDVGVHNFRNVIAYALENGNDEATLNDSVLKDEVYLKSHKSEIIDQETKGEIYNITARRFDIVHADASQGEGYDKVKMWETPHDNIVEAADNWARFYAQKAELEMLYDVLAFEFVKVRASTAGNDTTNVIEPLGFDLLFEDGWDM